ncbi:MAG: sigma-70 family RNA polymerase sigma factor [Anaerolineae bacterium]
MPHKRHDPAHLEALVSRARAGDREALARLWYLALPVTRARARRALHRLALGEVPFYDAEDLLQDLFLEFHRWLMQGPEDPHHDVLQRWSYRLPTVLRSLLRRPPLRLGAFCREQAWEAQEASDAGGDDGEPWAEAWPAPGPGPAQQVLQSEQLAQARAALASLAPEERELLWRRYGREEPVAEIARALGWAPGKVHRALRAARARLWKALQGRR